MGEYEAMSAVSGVEVEPPASDLVLLAIRADSEVGRDMNGSSLLTERIAWLNEQGEAGARREVLLRLLAECNRERNRARSEDRKRDD